MKLSNLPSILGITPLLVAFTAALPSPAPVELVPRACSTLAPSPIIILDSSNPNGNTITGEFKVERDILASGSYADDISTVITFNYIPDGATGCTLRYQLPALANNNQIASASPDYSSAFQTDVWTVAADPSGVSTWNNPPARDQFVSTIQFPTHATTAPYETNLWSGTCPQGGASESNPYGGTLSFLFEASTWQQLSGEVSFYNSLGGKQGLVPIGFSLVYNC